MTNHAESQIPHSGRGQLARRVQLLLGLTALVWMLEASYRLVVSPIWSYMGLVYVPVPAWGMLLSGTVAVAPGVWMPLEVKRPSQVAYLLIYVMAYIPSIILPWFLQRSSLDFVALTNVILFVCFFILSLPYHLPLIRMPHLHSSEKKFWLTLATVGTLLAIILVSLFGFRGMSRLSEVYSVRAEYKETLTSAGRIMDYAVTWEAYVLSPMLIAGGIIHRRWYLLAVGVVGELAVFSITGLKSSLFAPVGLLLFSIFLRRPRVSVALSVTLGTAALIGVSAALATRGRLFLMDYLYRRLFLVPGQLTAYYFEFFSSNPKALLGHSVFRVFGGSYHAAPPTIIGQLYIGEATHANANVWADAYANFGFPGMVFFTLVLAMVFWVFDSVAARRNRLLASLMMVVPGITLSNSALLTSLLTHGIGLILVLFLMMPLRNVTVPDYVAANGQGRSV